MFPSALVVLIFVIIQTIDLDNKLIILEDGADQLGPDDINSRISDTTPGY